MERSWGGEVPDWDLEPYNSDEEIEDEIEDAVLRPDGDGGGGVEFAFQNVLAAILLGTFAFAFGNVLLKLGVVAVALISAAFRYTAVGLFVFAVLALFA